MDTFIEMDLKTEMVSINRYCFWKRIKPLALIISNVICFHYVHVWFWLLWLHFIEALGVWRVRNACLNIEESKLPIKLGSIVFVSSLNFSPFLSSEIFRPFSFWDTGNKSESVRSMAKKWKLSSSGSHRPCAIKNNGMTQRFKMENLLWYGHWVLLIKMSYVTYFKH